MKKFEQDYEGFDSRNASEAHLAFADGDIPKNKVCTSTFVHVAFQLTCLLCVALSTIQLPVECLYRDTLDSLHRPGNDDIVDTRFVE
jgi:hypothetical protein